MQESLKNWDSAETEYRQRFGSQWDLEFKNEFEQDKAQFKSEIGALRADWNSSALILISGLHFN